MNEKIINVFFGVDCLPYKDAERQVHYPILGGAFLGASNTTKIRFYFDYIGDSNTTWVSVAKLPNGKQGSQVLSKSSDSDGNYAELELNSWYTQAKGDVYIALQGYQGGVEYSYDSSTELYEIHGTPTIQTTGSIKLAINYAPIGQVADYNDEFSTYQEILAALGSKLDITSGIIEVSDISQLVATNYENGQIFYNVADKKFYQLNSGDFVVFQTYITLTTSPISQDDYDLILNHPDYPIIYSGYLYWKLRDTGTLLEYYVIDLTYITGNTFTVRKELIRIQKSTRLFEHVGLNGNGYSQTYIDNQLATKQNTLVSGTNIRTINQQSLLGTGNIEIETGGGVWGEITGDIQDQTDLQAEFQDIRAEIAGRAQNISISWYEVAPTTDSDAINYKKFDGTPFTDLADYNSYVSGLTLANSSFYSTSDYIDIDQSKYIIDLGKKVIKASDIRDYYNVGNSNLFIIEQLYHGTDPLPDRWYSQLLVVDSSNFSIVFNALESKVNISGLATTGDLSMARYEIEREIAPLYDATNTYTVGEVVIYNGKLYRCTTAITTAEAWNSEHWEQVSVTSDFVNLTGTQVISGEKTFAQPIQTSNGFTFGESSSTVWALKKGTSNLVFGDTTATYITTSLLPSTSNDKNLGSNSRKWQDLHISGAIYNNTFKVNNGSTDTFLVDGVNGQIKAKYTILPYDNNTINLGSASSRFGSLFLGTYLNVSGFVDSNLRPRYNNTYDLGTTTNGWNNLYIKGVISDGTNSVSVADLAALITYAKGQGWIS